MKTISYEEWVLKSQCQKEKIIIETINNIIKHINKENNHISINNCSTEINLSCVYNPDPL